MPGPSDPATVLVVDVHPVVREGLPLLLRGDSLHVVSTAATVGMAAFVNVTEFTHAEDGNQYAYIWPTLAAAYSLAAAATVAANLLGLWAYRNNHAAFDHSFSTMVSITRGRELDRLFPSCCHGVAPLPEGSLQAPLIVKVTEEGRRPGRNIVLADQDVQTVCRACNPPPPTSL